MVFEPLIGELFRSGFVMQAAALQGDFVTPTIMGAGESDAAREQRGARALFRMLADDEENGDANKATMQGWLEEWTPKAVNAGAPPAADLVADLREGHSLRGLVRALASALRQPRLGPRPRDPEGSHSMTQFTSDPTSSNKAGVTLMNNQVGYVVADVMRGKENITITELPSMIRVDGVNRIDFDYEEIAEALGWDDFGNNDFEEIMSTHYGRMVVLDDRVVMFANPEDAAEYIDFDLQVVE